MAEETTLEHGEDGAPGGSRNKLIIILALAGVILIGASIGVTLLLVRKGGDSPAQPEQTQAPPSHEAAQPHYVPLKPLILSFAEQKKNRFVQAEMSVMTHDPAVAAAVERHMPAILYALQVLLGSQSFAQFNGRVGRDDFQAEIVAEINKTLSQMEKMHGGVEMAYFTNVRATATSSFLPSE